MFVVGSEGMRSAHGYTWKHLLLDSVLMYYIHSSTKNAGNRFTKLMATPTKNNFLTIREGRESKIWKMARAASWSVLRRFWPEHCISPSFSWRFRPSYQRQRWPVVPALPSQRISASIGLSRSASGSIVKTDRKKITKMVGGNSQVKHTGWYSFLNSKPWCSITSYLCLWFKQKRKGERKGTHKSLLGHPYQDPLLLL